MLSVNKCGDELYGCSQSVKKCTIYSCGLLLWKDVEMPNISFFNRNRNPPQKLINEFVACNDMNCMNKIIEKYPQIINMRDQVHPTCFMVICVVVS